MYRGCETVPQGLFPLGVMASRTRFYSEGDLLRRRLSDIAYGQDMAKGRKQEGTTKDRDKVVSVTAAQKGNIALSKLFRKLMQMSR